MRQKLAEERCKIAPYFPPSPQYIPTYEEKTPTLVRDLVPRPVLEGTTPEEDKKQEERRIMLELLHDETDLDYYSESDSDLKCN